MRVWPIGLLLLMAFKIVAQAPQPTPTANAPATSLGPVVVSPEVTSDRHVTFRLYAPHAQEVAVRYEGKGER
jgi:1,4-alpha-glucan branching enzyme